MFLLWGILVASPVVAVVLLGIIWFTHTLLVPLVAGDHQRPPWNRPSFTLAVIATIVALSVSALIIYNAVNRSVPEELLFLCMNTSAALLSVNMLVVAIELFRRRALSAASIVVLSILTILLAGGVTLLVMF